MNRPDFAAARERMQGTAATALGLAAIVLVFVYLVPRQGDIAAAMNARRAEALVAAQAEPPAPPPEAEPPPAPATTAPPASAPPTDAPASDASPSEIGERAATPPPPTDDQASQLLARPVVLDTATILIRQGKVRLAGIQAAPLSKKCGEEGPGGWYCGVEARTRFRAWLRARSINCDVPPGFGERPEEREARCDLSGEDIGGWLVANGYAEAAAGGAYAASEAEAKAARLGIWADKRPAD